MSITLPHQAGRRARTADGARASLAVALALGAVLSSTPAAACFATASASLGQVSLHYVESSESSGWSLEAAASMAQWARQLNVLLPPGASLSISDDYDTGRQSLAYCEAGRRRCVQRDITGERADAVLVRVARLTGATRERLRAARRMARPVVYTVQVFASRQRTAAWTLAHSLSWEDVPLPHQFYSAQGHPAWSGPANFEMAQGPGGVYWHRVTLGAFLSRADADAAREMIARATGLRGFVRRG